MHEFRRKSEKDFFAEHLFCILTPQSNAKKCWEAVEELISSKNFSKESIKKILKSKTRFHNNKTNYILSALKNWLNTKQILSQSKNPVQTRNLLAESIKGYGLKEASHFLRNIGKSYNNIAILDRHILKNLVLYNIIQSPEIKSKNDYLQKEQDYLKFAKSLKIPADELDLLLWSRENGEIFK